MGIVVQNAFTVQTPQLIDDRTKHATVADALQSITPIRRTIGLTVFITSESKEYWFRDGITNDDFIIKAIPTSSPTPFTWNVD